MPINISGETNFWGWNVAWEIVPWKDAKRPDIKAGVFIPFQDATAAHLFMHDLNAKTEALTNSVINPAASVHVTPPPNGHAASFEKPAQLPPEAPKHMPAPLLATPKHASAPAAPKTKPADAQAAAAAPKRVRSRRKAEPVDAEAPYGRKKDGTPKAKPGRRDGEAVQA